MRIVVFGSLNLDVSLWVPRLPAADETLHADRLERFCGGKGANQAVAAARLGAEVSMVGTVGDDPAGRELLGALRRDGVDVRNVNTVSGPTGAAFPIVTPDDVSIIVVRGANAATGADRAEQAEDAIASADVLLLQCEVEAAGVARAASMARDAGVTVVFNPAPVVRGVVDAVMPLATVLVVNRAERDALDPPEGLAMVTTLGPDGVLVDDQHLPAFPAELVDPTGAGDAFCGALAVGLALGRPLVEAARLGAACGSLAVGRAGAQASLPTRTEVDRVHPFPFLFTNGRSASEG